MCFITRNKTKPKTKTKPKSKRKKTLKIINEFEFLHSDGHIY